MAILYKIGTDGSFTAGDTTTGFTSYAYPSSHHATRAIRYPDRCEWIASMMTARELRHGSPHEAEYDARNWKRLGWLPTTLTAA